jgi:1-acyl-sn-glycerol-3-phosphate acyltransferase
MLAVVGADVHYSGLEHLAGPAPRLFVSNHQSWVDVWVLLRVLPGSARFVAKQELFRIPLFGGILHHAGFIPIDRLNRAEAIRSLETAAERLRAGNTLVLFAEGTRSRDGQLQPLKKGAFHLALMAHAPIVPIAIHGSFAVMRPGGLRVHPGRVDVAVGAPIDPDPYLPGDHMGFRAHVARVLALSLAALRGSPVDEAATAVLD